MLNNEQQSIALQSKEFNIVGGVLLKYLGNSATVIIPNGIISIGKEAFKNALCIKKVIFSETVTKIENNAFDGCLNLSEIEDYSNVSKFGDECFRYSGLKHITIGRSVELLGVGCFLRMSNLEVISYDPGKILRLKDTFAYCPKLTEVKENMLNFFPSCHTFLDVRHNPKNKRPTWGDAFVGTPYIKIILDKCMKLYKRGICLECGGKIVKLFFVSKCSKCSIDYKN